MRLTRLASSLAPTELVRIYQKRMTRTTTGIRHWETMPRTRLLRLARVSSSIAPSTAELTTVIP
ncbi:hypothetical protein SMAC4_13422 [Sordaria macrospora]|uniref:uncharacterized protein n=1 Tax=Sordaria macrospora TaxID=5147 RepID=UPI002B2C3718|nr:hypothetical protein SMAC4_13422 [Sordaria macrospora]